MRKASFGFILRATRGQWLPSYLGLSFTFIYHKFEADLRDYMFIFVQGGTHQCMDQTWGTQPES